MDIIVLVNVCVIVLGFFVLWKSGDRAVSYVVQAGDILQVTTFFLGFVVLAVASALPDLSVAISSALTGAVQVSAGDIIGANFADIALALGLAMVCAGAVTLSRADRYKQIILVGITGILLTLMFFVGTLTFFHGIFLILCYALVMTWVFKTRHRHGLGLEDTVHTPVITERSTKKIMSIFIKLAASLAAVFASSTLVVRCATDLASRCHLPLETIGATIIAIGTTLPEIVVSVSAVRRKEYSLAFASTLGSVFEQGTLILGLLITLSNKPVYLRPLFISSIFMFASFVIMVYCLARQRVTRLFGAILLSMFVVYLVYHAHLISR